MDYSRTLDIACENLRDNLKSIRQAQKNTYKFDKPARKPEYIDCVIIHETRRGGK